MSFFSQTPYCFSAFLNHFFISLFFLAIPANSQGSDGEARLLPSNHMSVLKVPSSNRLPLMKRITVGRNKTLLLMFPGDIRDAMVSSPDILDVVVHSSTKIYLIGKDKVGQSNATFFDARGRLFLTLEINVERDVGALQDTLNELLPGAAIGVRILNDTLILTGRVRTPADSVKATELASRFAAPAEEDTRSKKKVVNMLAVDGEEQVMLKVIVAEIERTALKQFGINLGASITSGNLQTSILTDNSLPLTSAQGLGGLATSAITDGTLGLLSSSGSSSLTNSGASSSWSAGGQQINGTIRALERNGLVRTLAEPNLTAVSGESAKFLAGGEYPVSIVDSNGNTSVTFKEYGVGLAFTPFVMSGGRISLKISVEVSELSNDGAVTLSSVSILALKKRQTESTVELPSGGSLAMAGLLSEDTRKNIDGFPGLKDLPVLGTLFRSQDYVKSETELVVIVTPYLVKPTARRQLARPIDGLAVATDMKANFLGHMNRIYGGKSKNGTLGTSYDPFIVE